MSEQDKKVWQRIRDEKAKKHEEQQQQQTSWAVLKGEVKPDWMKKMEGENTR
jgi:hypothetical protein